MFKLEVFKCKAVNRLKGLTKCPRCGTAKEKGSRRVTTAVFSPRGTGI